MPDSRSELCEELSWSLCFQFKGGMRLESLAWGECVSPLFSEVGAETQRNSSGGNFVRVVKFYAGTGRAKGLSGRIK